MAQDQKAKHILTAPPMNPQPRLSPNPFGELPGCDSDGCASARDTWPLHHVLRDGVYCRLCCSCILLSHRSLYCCICFLLVTSPSSHYDNGDTLMAPPAPTVTCQVCREAVAHLTCVYPVPVYNPADGGAFVCPPCNAAQNGVPFTYGPLCSIPLDLREARKLVLAGRMALAPLRQHATASRANADRKILAARDARTMANEAIRVALDLGAKADPSWVVPPPPSPENDDLAASDEEGSGAEADVGEVLLVRRNAVPVPRLPMLTMGTAASVVPIAAAEAKHTPWSSQSKPLFDLNENTADDEAEDAQAAPMPKRHHRALRLNSLDMKEVAMAAAEAARGSSPTPQTTLQLFPSAKASSSTKMPQKLQLIIDDDEE